MEKDNYQKIYLKIIEIQKKNKITTTAIALEMGVSVQTASNRINRLRNGGDLSCDLIFALEYLSKQKLLNI